MDTEKRMKNLRFGILFRNKTVRSLHCRASLTVEAALILPLTFYLFCALLCFFLFLHTQFTVFQGMLAVSDKVYSFGTLAAYVENSGFMAEAFGTDSDSISDNAEELLSKDITAFIVGEISESVINNLLEDYFIDNGKSLNCISGGYSGLDCSGSYAYAGDGKIVLKVKYTFEFPALLFFAADKVIEQHIELNGFYGTAWDLVKEFDGEKNSSENETKEEYVYVTRNGEVYHADSGCTYLSVHLSQVPYESIEELRNSSGGRYYPCEYCGYSTPGYTVYITEYGDRYHNRADCSRISRDVIKITKSQAMEEGKRACSKCAE